MKKNYTTYSALDLAQEAWFIKWVRGDAKAARFWERWLAEHPEKEQEVSEARLLVSAIQVREEEPSARQIQGLWDKIDSAIDALPEEQRTAKRVVFRRWWVMAAAAAVALLLTFVFYSPMQTVSVGYGDQLVYTLPDGSEVELNAGSQISFKEKGWESNRTIFLQGEAFFNVEKGNPFVVETDKGKVEVLGTSFNVHAWEDNFVVDCHTGHVRVSDRTGTSSHELTKGLRTKLEKAAVLSQPDTFIIEEKADWRAGQFDFQDEKMGNIIASIERQFDIDIEVEGDAKLEKAITFQFTTNNRDSVLANFAYLHRLEVVQEGEVFWLK